MTPFEVVYGVPPPVLLSYIPRTTRVEAVDVFLKDRDSILHELRSNL